MSKKVLIIGGVAGGASAAARLRRLEEDAEIIMFEKGDYISFANCGLPYHIGETIKERDKLIVQTPEAMKDKFNIDIRINSEVVGIDVNAKKVKVNSRENGIYEESYDYLILSPGAKPIKPSIEGIESNKIFTLRNIPDTDIIKKHVDSGKIKNAVVIGGGYIGVEMAENLTHRGIKVNLVEAASHILAPFDSDMVTYAEKELQDNGVGLILGDGVKSFKDNDNEIEVILNSGNTLKANIVILAIGVRPDTEFINNSVIEMGTKGHILVNEYMQTNIDNIYAVGDAIEVVDFVNKKNTAIPLAGPANKQGRIAADNICGVNSKYKGTQGTAIIKVFDLTAASTGNNQRTLEKLNIPYNVIYIHPQSHASYYPNAIPMCIKLIFNNQGEILGAQASGYDGVDKRIDDIATVMRLNGTIYDLEELELSYAPPYSSAKDPVNMAGFVAENVLARRVEMILPKDIDSRDKNSTILLDVRTSLENAGGYIENSINIPLDELRNRLNELDKNKQILIYCQIGLRGYIAYRILKANGFKAKNLTGGYKTYIMSKFTPNKIENDNSFLEDEKNNSQNVSDNTIKNVDKVDKEIDICGLSCPGPLMQVNSTIGYMKDGEILKAKASDPGFFKDIKAWCERTNNDLLDVKSEKGIVVALIKKGCKNLSNSKEQIYNIEKNDNKTIVVFSGDLDKAIASFIIANGAASMGKKVTMFFTFWGLNVLRKPEKVNVNKGFMDKMFGIMMPRGSKKLKLSNMNMLGMGSKMIRKVMKDKNISSLEELIKSAIDNGINIVACQMSMDVMGLKKEELIEGVQIGGVGYYLGEAEDSNVNLFI
ncbi:NADPH-dependent 2,4-dienoyl-CoA reductase/sulfur reductase-like enzyme/peroxiredoxin family protein/TusA-related sulfurtransferase/rhodanese-related sulfurtransferase [Clostridium tetanomorphum]|uniref:FAD-dependent oxidoreductase n=1 Tax=Clostridium tetanomorphum TaxID=1553 RepID=A0A923EEH1_CLOTT|nr:DsrE/DsrF/DrsH-like family protein [Clostridium tetanomorphum]KAJ49341.1 CoA-disulfide reductase [Clostridium tetanomorphum DSM 665]KAJ53230.1 CoA-disulfide reductase [Clostridium tetanomorphum DSM 665]MBC2399453.1 FAD-dependent oxidoreductase [Clostridium tetanomorphum]MBP1865739.1 NADPH-dependent 2,4-dienoyl-CoA reductase/sulfur reductase-like enzyme/peroxiredoxin family protein/TusA-related sulfurtransferase/rhodanese-related sulfurtransferase [Clostridium tetanomorphum]NRS86859.1 NADPH-